MDLCVLLGAQKVVCEFDGQPKLAALHTAVHEALCQLDQETLPTFGMKMMPEDLPLSDDSSIAALSSGSTIEVIPDERELAIQTLLDRGISSDSSLLAAVKGGDPEVVRLMLVAWGGSMGGVLRSALNIAVMNGALPMCRVMFAHEGCMPLFQHRPGWSGALQEPLAETLECLDRLQSPDLIQLLVEHGITKFGSAFFFRAAEKGRDWVFTTLIPDDPLVLNETLLHAVEADSLPTVRAIASHICVQHRWLPEALLAAVGESRNAMCRLLGELDAHDTNGMSCLLHAASAKSLAACDETLAYLKSTNRTSDVTAQDSNGWTCLMHAVADANFHASHGPEQAEVRAKLVASLISHGADHSVYNGDGLTALHVAIASKSNSSFAALLDHGACPNVRDGEGVPLLHTVMAKNLAMFEALVESPKLDINARDSNGRTALMRVPRNHGVAICTALLRKGADVGPQDNNGWTCLGHATSSRGAKIVTLLLNHGAGVNDGAVPPLLAAVLAANVSACRVLLKHGADVTKPAADGRTCMSEAARLRFRDGKAIQTLVHDALGDSDCGEPEAGSSQGAIMGVQASSINKRKRDDADDERHACAVCGAVKLTSGKPFPSAASVVRHASAKHHLPRSEYIRRFG